MSKSAISFDTYTWKARLLPVLICFLSLGLAIIAWFPEQFIGWGLLLSIATPFGLMTLFSELGRDAGKRKEPDLYDRWGGMPSVQLLRRRDETIDAQTKKRYHEKLAALVPGISMPSVRKEKASPDDADSVYASCSRFLREATRDKNEFNLIFKELVSYGFRRNLWGLRPAAILIALFGLLASALAIVVFHEFGIRPAAVTATVVTVFLNVWWAFRITRGWVRVVAFEYARALLAACETLKVKSADE